MYRFIYMIMLLSVVFGANAANRNYASKSALGEGKWVKIRIKETGFYKLTYSDLKSMGFSAPEKVSVHGYGGWPMDEDFSKALYYDDVPSVAVYRGSDYILFYGKGTTKWTYNNDTGLFTHENNSYSNFGYYFVTDATETNDVVSAESASAATFRTTTYDDYMVHEIDKVSPTVPGRPHSGRELFGESFDNKTSRDFTFATSGATNDNGTISLRFIGRLSSANGILNVSVNRENISSYSIGNVSGTDQTYIAALAINPSIIWQGNKSAETKINISFSTQANLQNCYLDYIRLQMKRTLQPYDACTFFRSIESINKATKFTIQNASSNLLVFDVTEGSTMQKIETELNGTEASFSINAGDLREFAMVDISKSLPTPETVGEVANQNLHGLEQQDMIILSSTNLASEAERLAAKHRSHDNLKVIVVTPEQVYNEFSSGAPEATAIRNFMKMFYDRKTSDDDAPKYLLLFGDGVFDNRQLTEQTSSMNLENYILTYQSQESLGASSYVSDDYFGFLEDNNTYDVASENMNIGVGRFPVSTSAQAKNAVDKVISYIDNTKYGSWKNRVCFVADDGNNVDTFSDEHMEQSNQLAEIIEEKFPEYMVNKIFFDAYKKDRSGGGESYPDVKNNIQKNLKEGVLLINYTGHGDAEKLSQERVISASDAISATYTNLPLWIIAACDFAPFDDAQTTSAGEELFLNAKSGAIALFSTVRVAWGEPNFEINKLFINHLFEKKDNRHLTLGDVMKNMKNTYKQWNKRSFVLLGDPAMKLNYPDFKAEITEINGTTVSEEPVTFRAFDNITLKGKIFTNEGNFADDFNGNLTSTVFDSKQTITTLDNNGTGKTFSYTDYPNTIYIGGDTIRNGEFSLSFNVPKDISYSYDFGKINLYASDGSGTEANGSYKNFKVGGTAPVSETDTVGPEIRSLYLNTAEFKDGDKVNTTPLFTTVLWDESGINVSSGGIGHDITLTIDNNATMNYTLNNYYQKYLAGKDGESIVQFSIPALEAGTHTAEFKVWDIYNNSTTKSFNFVVSEAFNPEILDLTAGPSPARESVTFMISHNMPEASLTVELQVFDLKGQMMWNNITRNVTDATYIYRWNLADGAGAHLSPGIYVYRAILTNKNFKKVSKAKKLVVLYNK